MTVKQAAPRYSRAVKKLQAPFAARLLTAWTEPVYNVRIMRKDSYIKVHETDAGRPRPGVRDVRRGGVLTSRQSFPSRGAPGRLFIYG
jgi:hypothetical protein